MFQSDFNLYFTMSVSSGGHCTWASLLVKCYFYVLNGEGCPVNKWAITYFIYFYVAWQMLPSYPTNNSFIKHIFYITTLKILEVTKTINKVFFEEPGFWDTSRACSHLPSSSHFIHPNSFTDEVRLKQTSVMTLALKGKPSPKRGSQGNGEQRGKKSLAHWAIVIQWIYNWRECDYYNC